jgi:TRAP-type C4-dicarboxylate transport system substrate-binding protein
MKILLWKMTFVVLVAVPMLAQAASLDVPSTNIRFIGTSLDSPPWYLVHAYWTNVAAHSEGKIKLQMQSITQLGVKGPQAVKMVRHGLANMLDEAMGFYSGEIPENDGIDLAGLAPDLKSLHKAVEAYQPVLEKLYAQRLGVQLLGLWPLAGQVFWCATPIKSLADFKGKRVRVFTTSMADFVKTIGAIPTTMAFSEVIPALQRGVIDCAITGTVAGNVAHFTDVSHYVYPLIVGWGMHATIANKKWWDGLAPQVRKLISVKMRKMVSLGWQQAKVGTKQGLWCSTGDARCQPKLIKPKPLTRTHLTLVPVTNADKVAARKAIEEGVLPSFAARCGSKCTAIWNATVGKALGVTARSK